MRAFFKKLLSHCLHVLLDASAIFHLGQPNPTSTWRPFTEMESVIKRMMAHIMLLQKPFCAHCCKRQWHYSLTCRGQQATSGERSEQFENETGSRNQITARTPPHPTPHNSVFAHSLEAWAFARYPTPPTMPGNQKTGARPASSHCSWLLMQQQGRCSPFLTQ